MSFVVVVVFVVAICSIAAVTVVWPLSTYDLNNVRFKMTTNELKTLKRECIF